MDEIDALSKISVLIAVLAKEIYELPACEDRRQALIKILEAKDLASRAYFVGNAHV